MNKQITLDDGSVVIIEKMPIGKYAELLQALQELPKKFDVFISVDKEKIMEILPGLIGDSLPDVLKIIEIATPISPEVAAKLGLSEIIDVLIAIAEVNNYAKVFEQIKKVMPQKAIAPEGAPKTL